MGQGSSDPAGGSGQASQGLDGARWRAYPIPFGGPGPGTESPGRESQRQGVKGYLEKGRSAPGGQSPGGQSPGGQSPGGRRAGLHDWARGRRSAGSQEREAASGTQPHGCQATQGTLTVSCWSLGSMSLVAGLPGLGRGGHTACSLLPAVQLHRPAVGERAKSRLLLLPAPRCLGCTDLRCVTCPALVTSVPQGPLRDAGLPHGAGGPQAARWPRPGGYRLAARQIHDYSASL